MSGSFSIPDVTQEGHPPEDAHAELFRRVMPEAESELQRRIRKSADQWQQRDRMLPKSSELAISNNT